MTESEAKILKSLDRQFRMRYDKAKPVSCYTCKRKFKTVEDMGRHHTARHGAKRRLA